MLVALKEFGYQSSGCNTANFSKWKSFIISEWCFYIFLNQKRDEKNKIAGTRNTLRGYFLSERGPGVMRYNDRVFIRASKKRLMVPPNDISFPPASEVARYDITFDCWNHETLW